MSNIRRQHRCIAVICILLTGCTSENQPPAPIAEQEPARIDAALSRPEASGTDNVDQVRDTQHVRKPGQGAHRQAYFGDLHIHTKNSSDAFMFKARATPDDAYRYALGHPIAHALGFDIQLQGEVLDFAAVTDHGELLGVLPAMVDPANPLSELPLAKEIRDPDRKIAIAAFFAMMKDSKAPENKSPLKYANVIRSAWLETIEAAERYNEPGVFTTFIGYEYSSAPENENLHRNVIFKSSSVPGLPFSSVDSDNPEDLWRWLDDQRSKGIDALAIPHNSNASNGLMFERNGRSGEPLDANYAALRMRNEPLVEVTQVKGTSETHPMLSPNDEWADFELYDTLIASPVVTKKSGGFVREAYRHGLEFKEAAGFNPYKFGLIGSSDTHNGGGSYREDNYFSKAGVLDGTAELRGTVPDSKPHTFGADDAATAFTQWGASGIAGIWAEENTRESLFSAMQRKETFATSGPRIRVRFFAGYNYEDDLVSDPEMIRKAYQLGVPMGADLHARDASTPSFLVLAMQDADSARLQRMQIVKGWVADGTSHEMVFDVACSDGLVPDKHTHRCPDNGARVNLADCSASADKGALELKTLWRDPDFDTAQQAFYYVRVLENPTCRWSTWDALRAGAPPKAGLRTTIQERAWSSPIWYLPQK